ncbi:MAG: VCBS repeat-containing protein [Syntrophobacteraceae bacterium]
MKKCSFISIWVLLITATLFPSSATASLVSGPDWIIAGVGDFNGDGCRDILWSNQTTGDLAVWYMHGNTLAAEQKFESAPDSIWDVVGVGDFNGDGSPDVLLRNKSTGDVRIWYLNGWTLISQETFAGLGSPWDLVGVGDFNGDGSPDILWRNPATGKTIVWYMKGMVLLGAETMETLPPPWNIIEIGDFDGDGSSDILWKNSATGDVVVWYMRGLTHLDPGAVIVRAPPLDIVVICSLDGDVGPDISRRHIATLSHSRRHFTACLLDSIVNSSLRIRAPPSLTLLFPHRSSLIIMILLPILQTTGRSFLDSLPTAFKKRLFTLYSTYPAFSFLINREISNDNLGTRIDTYGAASGHGKTSAVTYAHFYERDSVLPLPRPTDFAFIEGMPGVRRKHAPSKVSASAPVAQPAVRGRKPRRLLVHAGLHKTGTTALQAFLTSKVADLRRHGVPYPCSGVNKRFGMGQHNIAWQITRDRRFESSSGTIDDLANEVAQFDGDVILSSEDFESIIDEPERFAPLWRHPALREHEFTVLIYVRNQSSYLESLFLARPLLRERRLRVREWTFHFDYASIYEQWVACADANLTVRNYHQLIGGPTIADFCSIVCLDLQVRAADVGLRSNMRRPLRSSLLRFYANRVQRPLRHREVEEIDSICNALNGKHMTLSNDLRLAFDQIFGTANQTFCSAAGIPETGLAETGLGPAGSVSLTRVFSFELQDMKACGLRNPDIEAFIDRRDAISFTAKCGSPSCRKVIQI